MKIILIFVKGKTGNLFRLDYKSHTKTQTLSLHSIVWPFRTILGLDVQIFSLCLWSMCVRGTKGDVLLDIQIFMYDYVCCWDYVVFGCIRGGGDPDSSIIEDLSSNAAAEKSVRISQRHGPSFQGTCLRPINLINYFAGWKGNLRNWIFSQSFFHPMGDLNHPFFTLLRSHPLRLERIKSFDSGAEIPRHAGNMFSPIGLPLRNRKGQASFNHFMNLIKRHKLSKIFSCVNDYIA